MNANTSHTLELHKEKAKNEELLKAIKKAEYMLSECLIRQDFSDVLHVIVNLSNTRESIKYNTLT